MLNQQFNQKLNWKCRKRSFWSLSRIRSSNLGHVLLNLQNNFSVDKMERNYYGSCQNSSSGSSYKNSSSQGELKQTGTKPDKTYVVYTDGSCLGNHAASSPPAGWGYCILADGESREKASGYAVDVVHKQYGPVVTDPSHAGYLGADAPSNNTAELSAIGEALRYVHRSGDAKKVIIRSDSTYAAKSVQGIYNGSKNTKLIDNCRRILRNVEGSAKVEFEQVKGHSLDQYNDLADSLAVKGAKKASEMPLNTRKCNR